MILTTNSFKFSFSDKSTDINPDDILNMPGRDLLLLDEDAKSIPGLYMYYSAALANSKNKLADAQYQEKHIISSVSQNARTTKTAAKEKFNNDTIYDAAIANPDVVNIRKDIVMYEMEVNILQELCKSLWIKKDIYINMCNNIRSERKLEN